ncbi:hypothetical protein AB5N19_14294 [Seiridium cardinale]|uniref:Uncharacterized protein n=1 Tax=Seiridium cardinale TaxID=138064 RepID=A0ABR2XFY1_9PEZI
MGILLFCTAQEAKSVVPEVLATEQSQGIDLYVLAQYRNPDQARQNLTVELTDGETFESDFIGAREVECQAWAQQQILLNRSFDQELIAILDRRSALDKTIIMQFFNQKPGLDFPPYGTLPPEENVWYSFRIPYKDAFALVAALTETALDVAYPIYFGRKEEFTNEQGVFEVHRAEVAAAGKDQGVA